MTMKEKIARAMCDVVSKEGLRWHMMADAVLEAMRSPTPEMVEAARRHIATWDTRFTDADEIAERAWDAAIDAALTRETAFPPEGFVVPDSLGDAG